MATAFRFAAGFRAAAFAAGRFFATDFFFAAGFFFATDFFATFFFARAALAIVPPSDYEVKVSESHWGYAMTAEPSMRIAEDLRVIDYDENAEQFVKAEEAIRLYDEFSIDARGVYFRIMPIKSTVFNDRALHYCPPDKGVSMEKIFHLADKTTWRVAERTGKYFGSADDATDGFMHFSTREQVRESAAKHRHGVRDLLLLEVDAASLGGALRWEAARGGQLFPHLYAPLSVADVVAIYELPLGEDGLHIFPALGE